MNKTNKKQYTIGISCIGSGVGESVVNSCRLSDLPLKTVGFGTNAFAYGGYSCDLIDFTPTIYAPDFVEKLIGKCLEHQVDFLIPGRDDEALIYAKNREKFEANGINILAAGEEFIGLCRDKERMSLELNPVADVFVKCYKKEDLGQVIANGIAEFPLIAKPRSGFASHGVEIIRCEADFSKISSDHIIQELAVPVISDPNYSFFHDEISKNRNPQVSEISIQVVLSPEGKLLGKMASFNKLSNGVPIEIVPYNNEEIWEVVDRLLPVFIEKGLVGPLNIQGRFTKSGLKIFEMNPRFTGITGLRALLGFNEVEACIRTWLKIGHLPKLDISQNKFGIRQTADKVISFEKSDPAKTFADQASPEKLDKQRTVVITGSNGFLGRNLAKNLANNPNLRVVAFGRNLEILHRIFEGYSIHCFEYTSLENGDFPIGKTDILVHTAFSRPHCSESEIADSLEFSNDLLFRFGRHQIPYIINLSSQSVYGNSSHPLWKETDQVGPQIPYAQAKYATELMLKSIQKQFPQVTTVSLRLAALSGGQEGLIPVDFLSKLVLNALEKRKIYIRGGMQQLEIMDVRDAVIYLTKLIENIDSSFSQVYNLGGRGIYSLLDVAKKIKSTVDNSIKDASVSIEVDPNEVELKFGMDTQLIEEKLDLSPSYTLEATIESLIRYFQSTKV